MRRWGRSAIGRYRHDDLTPLGGLRLTWLALSGRLSSLAGAGALAPTLQRLSLDAAPNLASLDGIELLSHLEIVEIDGLRHITSVEWAARLPRLRLLDVFDQKGIESLWPLADHPSIEFLTFGRVRDLDLEPLEPDPEPQALPDRPLPLEPGPQRVPVHASSGGRRPCTHGVLLAQARLTLGRSTRREAPMGTWGPGPFDNDDAGDWAYQLTPDADERVIELALTSVEAGGDPDAPTSQAAIAAAEVVAAGLGHPVPGLPDEVAEWVGTHADLSWQTLAPLALRSVARIVAGSELSDLWAESDDDVDWSAELRDLQDRLTS